VGSCGAPNETFQTAILIAFTMPAVVSDTKRHDKEKQKAKQKQVQGNLQDAQLWCYRDALTYLIPNLLCHAAH
jgi:hypothetical protein